MSKARDITGQRFGRLVALQSSTERRGRAGTIIWICRCDCGAIHRVRLGALTHGSTKSCGCLRRDNAAQRNFTHGQSKHPLYTTWQSMVSRCHTPSQSQFYGYGSRGIVVCDQWRGATGFDQFLADMGGRHVPGCHLHRIDNDGPYSPENCEWLREVEHRALHAMDHVLRECGSDALRELVGRVLGETP